MADSGQIEMFSTDILDCPICYQEFEHPKVLPCYHIFCEECIHRHFMLIKGLTNGILRCPTCEMQVPLPVNTIGVSSLRNDDISPRVHELFATLNIELDREGSNLHKNNNNKHFDKLSEDQLERFIRSKAEIKDLIFELKEHTTTLPVELYRLYEAGCNAQMNKKNEMKSIQKVLLEDPEIPDANVDKQRDKRTRLKDEIENKYSQVVEWITTEQDLVHQRMTELKPLLDVANELANSASCMLILRIDTALKELLERALTFAETSPANRPKPSGYDKMVLNCSKEDRNSTEKLAVSSNYLADVPDAQKMTCKRIAKIAGTGYKLGKFNCPVSCAFAPNGDIMVADKNNFRLQVFDTSGKIKGELFKQKIRPTRVCINPSNSTFYVNQEKSNSIKVFSADGSELKGLEGGAHWSSNLLFHSFDSKGNIVMTDPSQYIVSIHQRESGETINAFSFNCVDHVHDENAPPPPPTTNPHCLTVTSTDNIVIAETKDNRVQVFSHNGDYIFSITNLLVPQGVCVDNFGNFFIAEGDAHRICLYNRHGRFVKVLLSEREGIKNPMWVEVNDGKLAVTQYGGHMPHSLLIFQLNYHKQTLL